MTVKITAIEAQKKPRGRVNIFADGEFALSLDKEVAAEAGLRVDQELDTCRIEALSAADLRHRCYTAALNLLSYRPRSETELKLRLGRRGFSHDVVQGVISRLKERGLVDDTAFARFWKESRQSFSPRSRRLVVRELRRKGVNSETAEEITQSLDDDDGAFRAVQKKVHAWANLDYGTFRRRATGYLQRRGFSYEVVRRAVEQAWQSKSPEQNDA